MDERAVREYLLRHDERFRELFDEHQQFEQKLAQFTEKTFLTSDEQFEETVLKKKKLALKDSGIPGSASCPLSSFSACWKLGD